MADRLEVQFSSIQQTPTGTTVTVRLYRLSDPVVDAEGRTTYPRVLLRSVTERIGCVAPFTRFAELYQDRAAAIRTQFNWNDLADIVCDV